MKILIYSWQPVIEALEDELPYIVLDEPSPPGRVWVEPKE